MDIITAHEETGSYRAAAELCGTTHKTVRRLVDRVEGRRRPGGDAPGGAAQHRRVPRSGGRQGRVDPGADLGQAAGAGRSGGGLRRLGPQLPTTGGPGQGGLAPPGAGVPPLGAHPERSRGHRNRGRA
ncbi:MAG: hypothetical protein M3N17_09200 [Actinomycetota bacterium]|nr:hypothetical protein [Actinomycetota bacterium]